MASDLLASDLLAAGLASDLAFLTLLSFADATNEHATIAHTYSNDTVHSKTASAITQPNEYTTHVSVTHLYELTTQTKTPKMVEYKEAQISHLKSTNQTNRRQYISLPLATSAALREADLPAAGLASGFARTRISLHIV